LKGFPYFEVSAQTGQGVDDVFNTLIRSKLDSIASELKTLEEKANSEWPKGLLRRSKSNALHQVKVTHLSAIKTPNDEQLITALINKKEGAIQLFNKDPSSFSLKDNDVIFYLAEQRFDLKFLFSTYST
jgi:hypothetical protein